MKPSFFRESIIKACLVLGGLALALVLSEMIAGKVMLLKAPVKDTEPLEDRYILKPHLEKTFRTSIGKKRYSVNSKGIRGDEFSPYQNYHILTVGGSTTECLFLDNEEAWPYLTQKIVNQQGYRIWVGNVGRSGTIVRDHIRDSELLLNQFPFIDAILLLTGINDLSIALAIPLEAPPQKQEVKPVPFYEKTALWQLYRVVKNRLFVDRKLDQGSGPVSYSLRAKDREKAILVDAMPPMEEKLQSYKEALYLWVTMVRQRGARPILVTQPTKWMEHLTEKEKNTLWFGWAEAGFGDQCKKYYSVSVLRETMAMYNQAMLDVCAGLKAECVDLAKLLPKDPDLFFDDCLFNAGGSFLVSTILAQYLTKEAPILLPSSQDTKSFKKLKF